MGCDPGPAYVTAQVAVPATATAFAPQPAMVTPASWKSTVPVRVPEAGAVAVTLVVYVTVWPLAEGFADEVTTDPVLP